MIDRCDLTLSRVVPRSGVSEIGGAMKTSSRPPTISPSGFDGSGLRAADQVLSLVEEPLDWVEVRVAERVEEDP